jgi:hypothetical protein
MRTEAEWQERERQLLARNTELVERVRDISLQLEFVTLERVRAAMKADVQP